ncbi:hypothetical protein RGU12_07495 [Fredinandcohnia sp. QZ13]|uniref:hypothetical protein n=1 Tax=Fredinandcohnia sp. QZ13 TaxID=3073144 RepID=UPI0028532BB3|nr:hypothetical protein [Fredinandcohnia sp. QZ13]MDR4887402.1 hypothetical protein [Fredinandcohnia sp. QZ13]
MNIFIMLPEIVLMISFFFITIGLWELRVGVDRKKYVTYMFTGLVLLLLARLFGPFMMMFLN